MTRRNFIKSVGIGMASIVFAKTIVPEEVKNDVHESTKWEVSTTTSFDDIVYNDDVVTMTSQISQHILSSKHMIV